VSWPSVAASTLAVVSIALGVACGNGSEKPPRQITKDDLSMMVLQREDVPAELNLLEEDRKDRGIVEPLYNPPGTLMFLREFERPPHQAESGTVVCIMNSAVLYETTDEARRVFRQGQDLQKLYQKELGLSGTELPWSEIHSSSLASLGDDRQALRLVSTGTDFCSSYRDEPAEAYFLVAIRYNVAMGLLVWTYQEGASLDEAVKLAEKQASRIDALFEGDDSP